ncbi:MAG TPA: DUF192 domain-containing protein [Chloroflexia bacterium]|nr:DUF192 domain-containing protein [Chloroflexia bacterium]
MREGQAAILEEESADSVLRPSSFVRIENLTKGTIVANKAKRADGFFARGRGLMLAPPLSEGGGLIIEPCNSIHMFFMRYPLDVLFIDNDRRVLFLYEGIKPWRVGRLVKGARMAIELPAGTINRTQTEVGDKLSLERPKQIT